MVIRIGCKALKSLDQEVDTQFIKENNDVLGKYANEASKVSNLVIINGIAAYDYEGAIIYNLEKPDEPVSLFAPTNECLYILLSKHPDTVPQSYFFEKAWENAGLTTTVNNFYQHISMLRRAFEVVGIDENTIITIPRRGLSLSKKIDLKYVETKMEGTSNDNKKNEMATYGLQIKKNHIKYSILILILILSVYLLSIKEGIHSNVTSIKSYHAVDNIGSCHLFSLSEEYKIDDVKGMIDSYKIDCMNEGYLYYSTLPFINRESLIYCNKMKGIENGCISYFTIK